MSVDYTHTNRHTRQEWLESPPDPSPKSPPAPQPTATEKAKYDDVNQRVEKVRTGDTPRHEPGR
jgi:hypothetical protein